MPYVVHGWTTAGAVGITDQRADARIFALVTRDEVRLAHSPPTPDGSGFWIVGRAACWTQDGSQLTKQSVGPTRNEPDG